MELTENSNWILPALEMNLCLRMLGAQQRMILPVAENDLPLERRMLDSFLYLMELGLVEPEGENFRPTARMRARLDPIAHPRGVLKLGSGGNALLAVYFGKDAVTLAEVIGEDGQSCRLSVPPRDALPRERESALEEQGIARAELGLSGPDGIRRGKLALSGAGEGRLEALRSALERAEGAAKAAWQKETSLPAAGEEVEGKRTGGRTER